MAKKLEDVLNLFILAIFTAYVMLLIIVYLYLILR